MGGDLGDLPRANFGKRIVREAAEKDLTTSVHVADGLDMGSTEVNRHKLPIAVPRGMKTINRRKGCADSCSGLPQILSHQLQPTFPQENRDRERSSMTKRHAPSAWHYKGLLVIPPCL